jgi:Gas vesicle synthesis protein GvpL/GvpF
MTRRSSRTPGTPRTSGTSGTSGTYVYCVVASRRPPSIGNVAGPPGTRAPRLLEVRPNRYLVVSDAPLDSFGEASLSTRLSDLDWVSRAAVAHDAVVERFITADAVLPMKVFTIFTSDERAIAKTRSDWDRIESLLKDVTGQVEWGLRLMFDRQRASAAAATPGASTGTSYLLAKQKQHTETVAHRRLVRRRTAGVVTALAAIARDVKERPLATAATSGSRLLLDAAFLVPRTRERRFRAAVARETRRLAPEGYAVHLSGPWPPYSFIKSA